MKQTLVTEHLISLSKCSAEGILPQRSWVRIPFKTTSTLTNEYVYKSMLLLHSFAGMIIIQRTCTTSIYYYKSLWIRGSTYISLSTAQAYNRVQYGCQCFSTSVQRYALKDASSKAHRFKSCSPHNTVQCKLTIHSRLRVNTARYTRAYTLCR